MAVSGKFLFETSFDSPMEAKPEKPPAPKFGEADLRRCAETAESRQKVRYAIMGFEKLGDEAKVTALRALIQNDGDVIAQEEADVFIASNLEEIQEEDAE